MTEPVAQRWRLRLRMNRARWVAVVAAVVILGLLLGLGGAGLFLLYLIATGCLLGWLGVWIQEHWNE